MTVRVRVWGTGRQSDEVVYKTYLKLLKFIR